MSKNVTFVIGKDGEVRIAELEGWGSGCLEATALLEQRLGGVDKASRQMTDEYNEDLKQSSSGEIEI
jgi:hypothetical protein